MLYKKGKLPFFQFSNFSHFSFLKHAIFTRLGGYSHGRYASLNISYEVGDEPEIVKKNLFLIKNLFAAKNIVWSEQIHSNKVFVVEKDQKSPVKGYDALITNLPKIMLLIKLADCQGILLCDPVHKIIAAIHCGWRGNVVNVIENTIKTMQNKFNTSPKDIWAGISPSLGPCCGEFKDYKKLLPKDFWQYKINNCYFDWWTISKKQLIAAGVPEKQIEIANICTVCDRRFFSYRRDGKKTGRFAVVIMLKDVS
ncbi:MAG: peptidoglycan editing factor PgeF [Candidatus Desulfofervidus auxilii]|nr:peptidoglycan editing factor PgeF [Candidatus Desulfofervidus auxilii]